MLLTIGLGVIGLGIGLLLGLTGAGGSVFAVPLLVMLMDAQGLPREQILHLAVGTSMSTILFTSVSSMRSHQKRGAIRWDVFRSMTPGILAGISLAFTGWSYVAIALAARRLAG